MSWMSCSQVGGNTGEVGVIMWLMTGVIGDVTGSYCCGEVAGVVVCTLVGVGGIKSRALWLLLDGVHISSGYSVAMVSEYSVIYLLVPSSIILVVFDGKVVALRNVGLTMYGLQMT